LGVYWLEGVRGRVLIFIGINMDVWRN
jgi:hypothetical protein